MVFVLIFLGLSAIVDIYEENGFSCYIIWFLIWIGNDSFLHKYPCTYYPSPKDISQTRKPHLAPATHPLSSTRAGSSTLVYLRNRSQAEQALALHTSPFCPCHTSHQDLGWFGLWEEKLSQWQPDEDSNALLVKSCQKKLDFMKQLALHFFSDREGGSATF